MSGNTQWAEGQRIVKIKSTDIREYGDVREHPIGVYVGEQNVIFFNLPDITALNRVYGAGAKTIFNSAGACLLGANFGEDIHEFAKNRFNAVAFGKNTFTYAIAESESGVPVVESVLHVHEHDSPSIVWWGSGNEYMRRLKSMQGLKEDLAKINSFLCINPIGFDCQDKGNDSSPRTEMYHCGRVMGFVTRQDMRMLVHFDNVDVLVRDMPTLCLIADDSKYVSLPGDNAPGHYVIDINQNGLSVRVSMDDNCRKTVLLSAKDAVEFCRTRQQELAVFSGKDVMGLARLIKFLEAENGTKRDPVKFVEQQRGCDSLRRPDDESVVHRFAGRIVDKTMDLAIDEVLKSDTPDIAKVVLTVTGFAKTFGKTFGVI